MTNLTTIRSEGIEEFDLSPDRLKAETANWNTAKDGSATAQWVPTLEVVNSGQANESYRFDWEESAETVIGKINGLYPNPGAWFMFNGERYKILRATITNANGKAGMVLSQNLDVACGKNSIKIIEIQRQGKRPQKSREFLLGSSIKKKYQFKRCIDTIF